MRYTFQESRIWEGGSDQLDPNGRTVTIKARQLKTARIQLPRPEMGRHWILTATDDSRATPEA